MPVAALWLLAPAPCWEGQWVPNEGWALLGCSTLFSSMFPIPSIEEGVEMLIKRARWLQNATPRLLPAQPLLSPSCLNPLCQNTPFVLQASPGTGCIAGSTC